MDENVDHENVDDKNVDDENEKKYGIKQYIYIKNHIYLMVVGFKVVWVAVKNNNT